MRVDPHSCTTDLTQPRNRLLRQVEEVGPTPTIVTSPAGSPGVLAGSASFGANGARHPLGGRWLWWSAIGFVALYLGAVRTAGGQRLDQAAMLLISAAIGSDTWAEVTVLAVSVGSMLTATAIVVAATAVVHGGRHALIGAVAAGTVVAGAELLKLGLDRPDTLTASANSFPSGHVAAVAGLAVALMIALPRALRWPVAVLVAGPAVGFTGLATIVLLWHRPSDVVGSVLLAVMVNALANRLLDRSDHKPTSSPASSVPHRVRRGRGRRVLGRSGDSLTIRRYIPGIRRHSSVSTVPPSPCADGSREASQGASCDSAWRIEYTPIGSPESPPVSITPSGVPRSTTASPTRSAQAVQASIPAWVCSGVL